MVDALVMQYETIPSFIFFYLMVDYAILVSQLPLVTLVFCQARFATPVSQAGLACSANCRSRGAEVPSLSHFDPDSWVNFVSQGCRFVFDTSSEPNRKWWYQKIYRKIVLQGLARIQSQICHLVSGFNTDPKDRPKFSNPPYPWYLSSPTEALEAPEVYPSQVFQGHALSEWTKWTGHLVGETYLEIQQFFQAQWCIILPVNLLVS